MIQISTIQNKVLIEVDDDGLGLLEKLIAEAREKNAATNVGDPNAPHPGIISIVKYSEEQMRKMIYG